MLWWCVVGGFDDDVQMQVCDVIVFFELFDDKWCKLLFDLVKVGLVDMMWLLVLFEWLFVECKVEFVECLIVQLQKLVECVLCVWVFGWIGVWWLFYGSVYSVVLVEIVGGWFDVLFVFDWKQVELVVFVVVQIVWMMGDCLCDLLDDMCEVVIKCLLVVNVLVVWIDMVCEVIVFDEVDMVCVFGEMLLVGLKLLVD